MLVVNDDAKYCSVLGASYKPCLQSTLRVDKDGNDDPQQLKTMVTNNLAFFVVFDAILVQNSFHNPYLL